MRAPLNILHQEMQEELGNILDYWKTRTVDNINGGFYGRLDEHSLPDPEAPKGLVMNCRILWTFSSAVIFMGDKSLLTIAHRAYQYITSYLIDQEYGGLYWTVTSAGNKLEDKKQIYGIAFCIYALAEYYKITQDKQVLALAVELFHLIEKYSYDKEKGGYFEAFTRDWKPIEDLRLSEKDANEKKTMNTHLHVVEAYTDLYTIWPDTLLKVRLREILENFHEHIINSKTHHLNLFLDENWQVRSADVSYGHDIEASWLLLESAEILGDKLLISQMKQNAILMSDAAAEGLDSDGSLYYETEHGLRHLVKERHWWVQAEAVVGFLNAWQLSNDEKYLFYATRCWKFIQSYIIDEQWGEWHWGLNEDYTIMKNQDKAGVWKCPYHNARMCMEVVKRLS